MSKRETLSSVISNEDLNKRNIENVQQIGDFQLNKKDLEIINKIGKFKNLNMSI